jgi:hypothetical protein
MVMRTRVAVVGVSVALAIGGVAACSSSQEVVRTDAAASPAKLVQNAADQTAAADSAKVSVTVDATGVPGTNGTATFTADGAIDNVAHRTQFSIDLSKLGASLPSAASSALGALGGKVDVVTDGTDVYLNLGSLGGILGATTGQSWVKIGGKGQPAGDASAYFAAGSEVLKVMGNAGQVTTVGNEQVRGVDTTHYRGTVNIASALAELPADQRAQVQQKLDQVGVDPTSVGFPVDVWVGKDGLVRRIQLGLDTSHLPAVGSAANVKATLTMDLYDIGQPVNITVPPANQVFTIDPGILGALGSLAGHH